MTQESNPKQQLHNPYFTARRLPAKEKRHE